MKKNGPMRIYRRWDEWECVAAGMYNMESISDEKREAYRNFLADLPRFEHGLLRVTTEWPAACEHFLTNENINRIAWLGQAAMCIETGVSCFHRAGFARLTPKQQAEANALARKYLHKWLADHAQSKHRELHQDVGTARLL